MVLSRGINMLNGKERNTGCNLGEKFFMNTS
jgi:hypothetical protein